MGQYVGSSSATTSLQEGVDQDLVVLCDGCIAIPVNITELPRERRDTE